MKEQTVGELTNTLINQPSWSDIEFYLIAILLTLILCSLLAFFKTLYSEKAKFAAIESSLSAIKAQTELTASVTETIKCDLEYQSWNRKEISQIRRAKLEEYVLLIISLSDTFHKEMEVRFFSQGHEYDDQVWHRAQLIQNLYFPELDNEHNELRKAVGQFKSWMGSGLSEIVAQHQKGVTNAQVSKEHMAHYTELLNLINNAVLPLEVKARSMSKEFHT
ncbi:hypothetical protein ACNO65_24910 [Vibrio campbellii]|uniref:hypothetical protein n=1 Tax=Vibrio campbellii TaxID=680 RepID=UPI00249A8FB3|nr:hypothetical protein [Vibrio campbellii]